MFQHEGKVFVVRLFRLRLLSFTSEDGSAEQNVCREFRYLTWMSGDGDD